MPRRDKINYYLDIAETVSQRCTCLRRHYGAIIVKNDEIISTGYAESNAIISASRRDCINATMYLTGIEVSTGDYVENANSCSMCKRMIINSGIKTVIIRINKDEYKSIDVAEWVLDDDSLGETRGY